jgi:hypothetical protein
VRRAKGEQRNEKSPPEKGYMKFKYEIKSSTAFVWAPQCISGDYAAALYLGSGLLHIESESKGGRRSARGVKKGRIYPFSRFLDDFDSSTDFHVNICVANGFCTNIRPAIQY